MTKRALAAAADKPTAACNPVVSPRREATVLNALKLKEPGRVLQALLNSQSRSLSGNQQFHAKQVTNYHCRSSRLILLIGESAIFKKHQ